MGMGKHSIDRLAKACFLALLASFFLLVLEAGVRLAGLDMLALRPLLYFQEADLAAHEVSDDVELLYGLRPGARETFMSDLTDRPRTVTVNSLGFRDPPRQAAKPAGVFRIVCLGTSHMYGAQVDDGETLPRYLEKVLQRDFRGDFEVWNAGVSAYTIRQLAAAGRGIIEKYSPDLVLLAPYNISRRAFLRDHPYRRFFEKDPRLYAENLPSIPFGDGRLGLGLLRVSAVYRLGVELLNRGRGYEPGGEFGWVCSQRDMSELPRFAAFARGRTRLVLLDRCSETMLGLDVPDILLYHNASLPKDVPPEYYMGHPPAAVYRLQAEVVARELARSMPAEFRRKAPFRPVSAPRGIGRDIVDFFDQEVDAILFEFRFHREYAKARALLDRLLKSKPDSAFYRARMKEMLAEEKNPPRL